MLEYGYKNILFILIWHGLYTKRRLRAMRGVFIAINTLDDILKGRKHARRGIYYPPDGRGRSRGEDISTIFREEAHGYGSYCCWHRGYCRYRIQFILFNGFPPRVCA